MLEKKKQINYMGDPIKRLEKGIKNYTNVWFYKYEGCSESNVY